MSNLTLLIPTLPERYNMLRRLQGQLHKQIQPFSNRIQIIYNDAGRHLSTGEKRNLLMDQVTTRFSVFIDDDDEISNNYISAIMGAIDQDPDCITFNGHMTTNGGNKREFVIKLGEKYEERKGVYYRFPNHIVPMKTDLVRHVKFPHIFNGEDYQWCLKIKDQKLLKTSIHIEQPLYHYKFVTNKPAYGPLKIR